MDRLLALLLFSFLRRRRVSPNGAGIPILMYHNISNKDESGLHPYFCTNTSKRVFAAHMKFLHDKDYSVVGLRQIVDQTAWKEHSVGQAIVITFDDGYRSFDTVAAPILRKFGFSATVFLPTGYIGKGGSGLCGQRHLSWKEIKGLHQTGFAFGSHTINHPDLRNLNKAALIKEIGQSKGHIEDVLGEPVEAFSYPFAFPAADPDFITFLRETLECSGYKHGVTTVIGRVRKHHDRYFLRRIPINSFDDLSLFEAKIRGSYEWLRPLQYVWKRAKPFIRQRI
jgi:peptidoglycan/xylan/chitin deacetylase (PgdA/CDA1 family)